jgi:hypothetical protein
MCCEMKPAGGLDAGNRPVRLDERGREVEPFKATAPFLDSTRNLGSHAFHKTIWLQKIYSELILEKRYQPIFFYVGC